MTLAQMKRDVPKNGASSRDAASSAPMLMLPLVKTTTRRYQSVPLPSRGAAAGVVVAAEERTYSGDRDPPVNLPTISAPLRYLAS